LLTYIEVQIAGFIASLILLYVDAKRAKSTIPSTPT